MERNGLLILHNNPRVLVSQSFQTNHIGIRKGSLLNGFFQNIIHIIASSKLFFIV